jgi:ribosomal protein S18 acetylase RimI-like enzyme
MIRQATIEDISRIATFQMAMALETENLKLDAPTLQKGIAAVFADSSKGQYFVYEINGKVEASLMITYEWSDWRNGVVWWIQSVFVTKEYRGQGVYKKMYEHLKEIISSQESIRGLRLYVDKTNAAAQKVYSKLGMNGEHYQLFEWMKD